MKWIAAFLLLVSAPAWPDTGPDPDPRYQTFNYNDGIIFHLPTSLGNSQTILFDRNEKVQSVILSDPNAYAIDMAGSRDGFQLKPNGKPGPTILSVRTDQRSYEFELALDQVASAPQIVRFTYETRGGRRRAEQAKPPPDAETRYKLRGDKELRPVSLSDDGQKTYIAWAERQAMPAVFAIGPSGKEQLVDGYVRAGLFTIDRVYDELVFRIDKSKANARRIVKKRRNRDD